MADRTSKTESDIRAYISDAKKYGYVSGVPWHEVEKLLQEIDRERVAHETKAVHVAGDSLSTSLAMFQHKCSVHIAHEQEKPNPDNALIDVLCEAIRLCRENERLFRGAVKTTDNRIDLT